MYIELHVCSTLAKIELRRGTHPRQHTYRVQQATWMPSLENRDGGLNMYKILIIGPSIIFMW